MICCLGADRVPRAKRRPNIGGKGNYTINLLDQRLHGFPDPDVAMYNVEIRIGAKMVEASLAKHEVIQHLHLMAGLKKISNHR